MRPVAFFQSFAIINNNLLRHGLWFLCALYCFAWSGAIRTLDDHSGTTYMNPKSEGIQQCGAATKNPQTVQGRNLILKRILMCNCFCIGLCIGDYVLDYSIGLIMYTTCSKTLYRDFWRFQKRMKSYSKIQLPRSLSPKKLLPLYKSMLNPRIHELRYNIKPWTIWWVTSK